LRITTPTGPALALMLLRAVERVLIAGRPALENTERFDIFYLIEV
jgi:hypothetical protein